jgi:hypothetical protein
VTQAHSQVPNNVRIWQGQLGQAPSQGQVPSGQLLCGGKQVGIFRAVPHAGHELRSFSWSTIEIVDPARCMLLPICSPEIALFGDNSVKWFALHSLEN